MSSADGLRVVQGLLFEWQAFRAEIAQVERDEHPSITDRFGRVWVWEFGDLYVHDDCLAFPMDWITDTVHPLGLPSPALADNPNYSLCEICRREWREEPTNEHRQTSSHSETGHGNTESPLPAGERSLADPQPLPGLLSTLFRDAISSGQQNRKRRGWSRAWLTLKGIDECGLNPFPGCTCGDPSDIPCEQHDKYEGPDSDNCTCGDPSDRPCDRHDASGGLVEIRPPADLGECRVLSTAPEVFLVLPLATPTVPGAKVTISPAYVGAAYPASESTTWIDPRNGVDAFRIDLPADEVSRLLRGEVEQ